MTALQDIIVSKIRAGGPMPFAAYMSMALYHPVHGYYASGAERTGWRGHFLTSPELDPAYGQLWASGFASMWEQWGRPDDFHVVEIGPGEGSFAEAVLATSEGKFADALRYCLVERVPALAERQGRRLGPRARVEWTASVTELPMNIVGCIFVNEVLDNLPAHVVKVHDGELHEVCVVEQDGRLRTALRQPSTPELAGYLDRTGVTLAEGHRFEVGLAAESLVQRAAAALKRGALVFVDYGADATELAARADGSLVSYSEAGVDDAVLDRPGHKDITAHVNWTSVAAAASRVGCEVWGPRPQRAVLASLGLAALDDELKAAHDRALGGGDGAAAVRTLSRRQALGALADPAGLGGLDVLVAGRDVPPPSFIKS